MGSAFPRPRTPTSNRDLDLDLDADRDLDRDLDLDLDPDAERELDPDLDPDPTAIPAPTSTAVIGGLHGTIGFMAFDGLLRAGILSARDVDDLRFFGVTGALVPSDDAVVPATPAAIRRGWDGVVATVRRLRREGLAAFAAIGIHPRRIPVRGLEALLAELPDALGRPEVAAIGAIGLAEGGEHEERVLERQLELARELRLPVLVETPWRAKERMTKRVLAVLRAAELEAGRVLVAGAGERTVRAIRACGYLAGLPLSAGGTRGRPDGVDAAVAIVRALGPEGLVLTSDAGLGGGDLLALPRAADRLARAGLSEAVVRRVCGGNAVAFLGVEAGAPARRSARSRRS